MTDMEVRPDPGQDVVVIAPAGTKLGSKVSYNSTRTRARVKNTGTAPEPAPVEAPPVEPPPVEPLPTAKVVRFPLGGTPAQLEALMRDTTIDVIELSAGTYPRWSAILSVPRPSTRPLIVRPAPGAAVVWDGSGTYDSPAWRLGWNSLMSYVTFDSAGTGGSFTIQNYRLGLSALVMSRYTDHVTFSGVTVRGCSGDVSPQTTHCVYLDTDGTHRTQYWTSDRWDVVGPTNRYLSGLHIYHDPNTDHVTARDWTVRSLHRAAYVYSNPTDVVIDGWTIADCNATIDNWGGTAQGRVANCHATNAGPLKPGLGSWKAGSLADGGGNTSS